MAGISQRPRDVVRLTPGRFLQHCHHVAANFAKEGMVVVQRRAMLLAQIALPFEKHDGARAADRRLRALQHPKIGALRVHLDQCDVVQGQIVQSDGTDVRTAVADEIKRQRGRIFDSIRNPAGRRTSGWGLPDAPAARAASSPRDHTARFGGRPRSSGHSGPDCRRVSGKCRAAVRTNARRNHRDIVTVCKPI